MKPNPVGWFEIYVQDMKRAKTFYEAVLQGKLEQIPNPTAGYRAGNVDFSHVAGRLWSGGRTR